MDWVTGIQRAVDYVEAHLLEPISFEEAAKQAYSSSFHFQRVFSILCGYTLGDYIRWRRLSLAGVALASMDCKVIDVALQYGYDTPESFSRAFTRFHGISPRQAKLPGAALKSFSPLSVKLSFIGGTSMEYRIETKDAFELICKKKQIPSKEEMTTEEIAPFWAQCMQDGTIDALCRYIPEQDLFGGIVGVSFGEDCQDPDYPYAIAAQYNGEPVAEADLQVQNIPAHTYVVFPCKGKMPQALQTLYQKICSEFFPNSEYQPGNGPDFEVYPSADVDSPDFSCEIWVAAEKK